jgi:hypothetical protein
MINKEIVKRIQIIILSSYFILNLFMKFDSHCSILNIQWLHDF